MSESLLDSASAPEALGPDQAFSAYLDQGRFMLQRCGQCSGHVFFPRLLCPHCGARSLRWVDACGLGVVYAVTVVRRKPKHGGDYNVSLIDLAEGPRMMSRVEGLAPDAVRIGMPVRARIDGEAGAHFLVFDPAEGA